MPSCQFRERPGLDPVCKVMVDAGEDFCPRHKAMEQARQAQQLQKELGARLKKTVTGITPLHRRGMIERGYQYVGNNVCACGNPIEWWRTPNQREAPYEPMPEIDSPSKSHFVYCKRAFERPWKRKQA